MKLKLTDKDASRREAILFKSLLKTLILLALPLMMYNAVNSWFRLFDAYMATYIGSDVVSSVAYLNQIKNMIAAIGTGISLAGGILISKNIGAHNLKVVKQYVNTMFFIAGVIGMILLVVTVFTGRWLLAILGMPNELIETGIRYFYLEMFTLLLMFLNQVFIAIERAKGNTKKIFRWNIVVLIVKLVMSLLFVFGLKKGIEWLAIASILAQASLTISGGIHLFRDKGVFGFDRSYIKLKKEILLPLFSLALPIFFERFVFSYGKVFVNSMSKVYGTLAVGALGISNNISGLVTTPCLGVKDAEASIVSQNIGFGQFKRTKQTFLYATLINGFLGVCGMLLLLLFTDPVVNLFGGGEAEFSMLIKQIFHYEALAIPLITITSSCMGFLNGMGRTKTTMVLNMVRLLGYRIPVLLILIRIVKMGPESLGVAMMVSNGLVGITALITTVMVIKSIKFSCRYQK